MNQELYYTIEKILKEQNIDFKKNYNLSFFTPFEYPLLSRLIIQPKTQKELIDTVSIFRKFTRDKIHCFGNFSNTIIHENSKILNKPIIITRNLKNIQIEETKNFCEVECGYPLPKFSSILTNKSYKGFSSLLGIPGSIGGAIFMNAGSFGQEISDKLISVNYLDNDLNIKTIFKKDINFDWRYSDFQNEIEHQAIISARFNLDKGDEKKLKQHMLFSKKRRSRTQEKPGNNFGSVFATRWIYGESNVKDYNYKIINNFINFLFTITKKFRPKIVSLFLTNLIYSFNKKYFDFKNNEKIIISQKTLNCFLIKNEKTKPSDYINFIYKFKKKFKPKCKVEIRIYD